MRKNSKRKVSTLLAGLALFMMGLGFAIWQPNLTTAEASTVILSDFTVEETASVRAKDPVGIRFTVNMGEEAQSIYDDLQNVECGSILLPENMLNGELTLDTANVLKVPTVNWKEEGVSYQSVLGGSVGDGGKVMDIPESYYNRPIAARGYIKGELNGKSYVYYTENTASRSIGYVATMAFMAGRTDQLTTDIANKTNVALVAENITLSLQDGDGALLRNSYATSVEASEAAYLEIGGVKSPIEVTYEITDGANVAEIVDGKIVAKAEGSATIRVNCTYNDVEYETAEGTITVNNVFVGETDYVILLPENATANEIKAANTVQKVFNKTGATVSIVTEAGNENTNGKYISIGETALAKANVALSVTESTSSEVKAVGNAMFIRGVSDVGTLNGAQQWLGDALGYEYYLRDTYTVDLKAVDLPSAKSYVPQIRNNMIDRSDDVRADYGLQKYSDDLIVLGGNLHNSTLVLDPDTYYNAHTNWYATKDKSWYNSTQVLIKDSSGKAAELCYTAHGSTSEYNAMVSAAAAKIVEAFKANPTLNRAMFSVRDGNYICQCSSCEGKGNTSDTFVAFLNDVCAQVESGLAGDSRQQSFKIATLAYHQTNAAPKKITSLANYASFKNHIELWFGDSYGDYTDGLKDSSKSKNQEIYTNFQNWKKLVGTDTDILLWVYYTNTKNGFVPYNTFTAIRENYAMAAAEGVAMVYNQTIQGRSGWTMLKHYLISQLAWNATPSDAEWNAWIDAYFTNAYGSGATAMRKWFNDWLDDSVSAYATSDSNPAIHKDMATKTNFPKTTLEKWIGYADAALLNLDESDPNYQTYKNNILLEKLSPEYFLIELYGMTADYAKEFVWGVNYWGIDYLGEGVKIDATLNKIAGSTDSVTIEDKFYAEKQNDGTFAVTLENGNIQAGESYSIKGASESGVTAVEDGKLAITLPESAMGKANEVTLTSADYSIVFTNVIAPTKVLKTVEDLAVLNAYAATGSDIGLTDGDTHTRGYYVLGNDIDCGGALFEAAGRDAKKTFLGTLDGNGHTISNIRVGTNGIFSVLAGTVKDVNFTGVSLVQATDASKNMTALFAGQAWGNVTIENVYVQYDALEWPCFNDPDSKYYWAMTGMLAARWSTGDSHSYLWKNVTLDATGLQLTNVLGCDGVSKITCENVTVLGDSYVFIGSTTANLQTPINEWPDGVTYKQTEKITISDKFIADGGVVMLGSEQFVEGEVYTVRCGSIAVSALVEEDGVLVAELAGISTGVVSVSCSTTGKTITFDNVLSATKVIRTAEDLNVLNAYTASGHITGYYVLGGDIDCGGATFSTAARDGNKQFQGTFDGQGYTISNLKAGANGIFNLIVGGTVKNVNFTGVSLVKDNSHFTALLAGQSWGNTTIENINVTYESIEWPINNVLTDWAATGLLVARWSNATGTTVKDVTLDATGLAITNAIGCEFMVTFTNVTIKGDSYALIGCTAANSSSAVSEWPAGVTYVCTLVEHTNSNRFYADGGVVTVEDSALKAGVTYTLTYNGTSVQAVCVEAGKVSASFANMPVGSVVTVLCKGPSLAITFNNVLSATKVLRTAEDLKGLDAYAAGTHLKGYYVLGGDINCNGMLFESAGRDANKTFQGTLDGDGHTISNIRVGTNGIFSVLDGATIKNVNFTGASLVRATTAGNHMTAFFAGQAWGNVVIENVSVEYDVLEWPCYNDPDPKYYWVMTGMLVARWSADGTYLWKNVTLDATGLNLTNVFGCDVGVAKIACENVTVKGDSYTFIGSTSSSLNTPVSAWPTGVTYEDTLVEVDVTAPAASDYYTFSGASYAGLGKSYTFTVTEKVSGLNDFIVLVNGEEIQGNNGTYTVENVAGALEIKVLHGYIEADESVKVSVEYSGDTIKVTNAIWAADGTNRIHGHAYISAEYIEYMISQGYKYVGFTAQADGTIAAQAIAKYNGKNFMNHTDGTAKYFEATLVAGSNSEMEFWAQDDSGSGGKIKEKGGYVTLTGLAFYKEKVAVTAPAENEYYTFSGSTEAGLGTNYTFTVTEKVSGLNAFVVLVNGVEIMGDNGTYTVENVTEALEIKVLHPYIEHGSVSSVSYNEDGVATVTNSTSTNSANYMAYISAEYVNYLISKGYNYWDFYIVPDGTIANQTGISCGNTITRNVGNASTSIARVKLQADTAIVFWCQQDGSGSKIQGAGGYMTVTYGQPRVNG